MNTNLRIKNAIGRLENVLNCPYSKNIHANDKYAIKTAIGFLKGIDRNNPEKSKLDKIQMVLDGVI